MTTRTRDPLRRSPTPGTPPPTSAPGAQPPRRAFVDDRRLLALLIAGGLIAVVIVFIVALSLASFTESSKSTGNSLAAGEAALGLSPSGQIVSAANMRPGDTRSDDVEVTNSGQKADVSLAVQAPGSAFSDALKLKVTPRGEPANVIYNGAFAAPSPIQFGSFAAGRMKAFTLSIFLPQGTVSSLGGSQLAASLKWEARTP